MKYISFTGAQSTGKTTLIKKCMDTLPHSDWEFVPEVTRLVKRNHCVDINELGNDDTQILILAQHLSNANCSYDRDLKGVIMDRCIIDGLVYTNYLYSENKVSPDVAHHSEYMFNKLLPKLDLVFYTSPKDIPLEDDGERSINIAFRDGILNEFEDILYYIDSQYDDVPEVIRLEGTVEERLDIIMKALKYEDTVR